MLSPPGFWFLNQNFCFLKPGGANRFFFKTFSPRGSSALVEAGKGETPGRTMMWNNAGRFLRDALEAPSSSSSDEETTTSDFSCHEECLQNDSCSDEPVPDPPSTLIITRRQRDFGVVNACVTPQDLQCQPDETGRQRDLVAVSMIA